MSVMLIVVGVIAAILMVAAMTVLGVGLVAMAFIRSLEQEAEAAIDEARLMFRQKQVANIVHEITVGAAMEQPASDGSVAYY